MRIVVTGGAGFLGSHLCERLADDGHEVICVDNLSTGRRKNILNLTKRPNFVFIKQDVSKGLIGVGKFDQIYHLASPASPNIHYPKSYLSLSFETMQANSVGTWKVAEAAVRSNASMLFTSTSEIYGDPLEHPQKETYRGNVNTIGPRSVYDEAKRFGETIVSAFCRKKKLAGRIVRIFNTYGPKMAEDDGRVVTEFIIAAKQNKPIPVFGDGKQTRSFCYVSDLIDGLIKVMNHKKTVGEVFNLGNPDEFTILQLAELVIKLTGSKSKIIRKEKLPIDDPKRRRPDISKVTKLTGWKPKVKLIDGLKLTLENFG